MANTSIGHRNCEVAAGRGNPNVLLDSLPYEENLAAAEWADVMNSLKKYRIL